MTRLTVLYNLPDDSNEDEFLRWRLGAHQANNTSMPGVIYTDFAKVEGIWPQGQDSPYAYMTIVDFESREVFEQSFYAPNTQNKLKEDLKRIKDPLFLISDVLTKTDQRGDE